MSAAHRAVEIARVDCVGLPVAMISSAKLVLTDELVRDALRRAKSGGAENDGTKAGKAEKNRSGRAPKGRTASEATKVDASKMK